MRSFKNIGYLILIIFQFAFCTPTQSQNLFANPGFEDINVCVEYHAYCAPEAWFNIPATNILVNAKLAPRPVSGNMALVVPAGNVMANFNKPRFVYTGLCCPLVAKEKYQLSFFLHSANIPFQQLTIYFTGTEPTLDNVSLLTGTPSIMITTKNIDSVYKNKWMHVQYEYKANGRERFCIISATGATERIFEMKDAMNKSGDVLCFIDDIQLIAPLQLPVCSVYDANIKSMYGQNYRHTDDILALPGLPETKPVVQFKNDTVTIAALLFDVGKYDLKPGVKKILDSLSILFRQKKVLKIEISGHTDNSGDLQNNQELSVSRAVAIQQYIEEKIPEFSEKISTTGKGQLFPVATNATSAGREKNRRVEIVITYFTIQY